MKKGEVPQTQTKPKFNTESRTGNQTENTVENKPQNKIIFADEGEGVINYQGIRPPLRHIFNLTQNNETGKHRAVAVPVNKMPIELLFSAQKIDYIKKYTDEIVFSPVLKIVENHPDSETPVEKSIAGAVIKDQIEDEYIRPGKRIIFINIGRIEGEQIKPEKDINIAHRIVHEARHRETMEKVTKGEEPIEHMNNIMIFEKLGYQKELEFLQELAEKYESKGLKNTPYYEYCQDAIDDVTTNLNKIQQDLSNAGNLSQ